MPNRRWLLEITSEQRQDTIAVAARCVLSMLTPAYRAAVGLRNRFYDLGINTTRIDAPVISIGNLTTGGTGKTPLVIWLAQRLIERRLQVAVISRGYGRRNGSLFNDEALEIGEEVPGITQIQRADRVAAARQALDILNNSDSSATGKPVILLDDGFQHRRLYRDLEIVVLDATNPFGYGRLLPRGLLREPIGSVRRADVVILSRCNQVAAQRIDSIRKTLEKIHPETHTALVDVCPTEWKTANHEIHDLATLAGQRVFAFCGIGNPLSWLRTLDLTGVVVAGHECFPDHHLYSQDDINWLVDHALKRDCSALVCTRKDAVKLADCNYSLPIFSLSTQLEFREGEKEIMRLVERRAMNLHA
jgi:tetraacyldisaccharide 4'-kinase